MINDYKEKLYNLYDNFSVQDDLNEQDAFFNEINDLLESLSILDSEDYYIWGLSYYMSDTDIPDKLIIAKEKFLESLELDERNFLARLYLAHCYHDMDELRDALDNYLKVDINELKDFQFWRYVKLIEQIGYCNYRLGNKDKGLEYFQKVLDYYQNSTDDDFLSNPVEMISCLPEDNNLAIEMRHISGYKY